MKYDKEHIDRFMAAIADGKGILAACKIADIVFMTYQEWKEKPEFSESYKKAEEQGRNKRREHCENKVLSDASWQSAAWYLERYEGKVAANKLEISGDRDKPITIITERIHVKAKDAD
jgi:hypothetical protein